MATERQSPDAILVLTGLSGVVGDIQDDPDSPDANWLIASGNNVNTDARTSFPSPTGNPTVGADLQEFRAQVRQFDTGQTGTPDARIELWENGSLVRAGSDVPVTGTGQVIAFTWNANELATADGSLVECKVVGKKSGGSPSARNTVEVGAIEWNVDYTSGSTTYYETHSMSTAAAAAIAKKGSLYKTITASGSPSMNRKISLAKVIAATGTIILAKTIYLTKVISTVGAVAFSKGKLFTKNLVITATGVVALTKETILGIIKSIAATGTLTLNRTLSRYITNTTVATPIMARMIQKSIASTAVGTLVLSRNTGLIKSITAAGTAVVTKASVYSEIIIATATGIAGMVKTFIAGGGEVISRYGRESSRMYKKFIGRR